MKRDLWGLFLSLLLTVFAANSLAQDMPHENIDLECEVCHSIKEWSGVQFDHAENTGFVLDGRHADVDCELCHTLKDFSIIERPCLSCHKDIHEAKLGPDCARCHTTDGFTIFNIEDIHAETNFPLMGRHALADCQSCHKGLPRGDLSFETTRCVGCHQQQYLEVTSPNHVSAGFATDCDNCHQMSSWRPAMLTDHDIFFPIFSGEHAGEWDNCATCHVNPDNYQDFSCLSCHEHNRADTDEDHLGIPGYNYNSQDCFLCHPRGEAEPFVDHDALYFPIFTGSHSGVWSSCSSCHDNPSNRSEYNCLACHESTVTENIHQGITGYTYVSTACLTCHPDGSRIEYTEHDAAYFPIYTGTHAAVWNECSDCHTNPADRSVYDCLTCHSQATIDIVHQGMTSYSYVSTACFTCHPTGVVENYLEHDASFFPIYSGPHNGVWADCATCHTDPANRSVFTCLVCHEQTETDNVHAGITGYVYNSTDCLTCHPDGTEVEFTEHDIAYFPIYSGSHASVWSECATCHTVPGDRTIYDCLACHQQSTADIIHMGMPEYSYSSTVCYACHPRGVPEDYPQHDVNGFFPIYSGTHSGVWAECSTCHTNPDNRSVFTCLVCHEQGVIDPVHLGMISYTYESNTCYSCHPNGIIEPYLEHDTYFFPIYSGTHAGRWASCATCHIVPTDKSIFSCLETCHKNPQTDNRHTSPTPVPGYIYDSQACYDCHPTGQYP